MILSKEQRNEKRAAGITIIRETLSPHHNKYYISFLTDKGGWARLNNEWLSGKSEAQIYCQHLVSMNSNYYYEG